MSDHAAFLLTREWRDREEGLEIVLWAKSASGPIRARFTEEEAVMFVPRSEVRGELSEGRRQELPMTSREGLPVDALYFRSQRALVTARESIRARLGTTFEGDVKPSDRFVMERFVTGGLQLSGGSARVLTRGGPSVIELVEPRVTSADVRVPLTCLSLDLETDGWDGPVIAAAIAMSGVPRTDDVWVVGAPRSSERVRYVADERTLLHQLFARIVALDPDVIVGWNVIEFDLTTLERRARALGVGFGIGRLGERARVLASSARNERALGRVPGRVVLDGPAMLRAATYTFERYSLEHVARHVLGRGKKIADTGDALAEIRRMHREDPEALAAYNLEDAVLALEVFEKTELLDFVVERARLTGLPLDRVGGAVAAFDHLYLPRLHRRGVVAPDVPIDLEPTLSPGGHVLEPMPGLYQNVLAFDFRSLYPSLILTFGIDPLGLAQPGEDPVVLEGGTAFSRSPSILSEIIEPLWDARARAQREGKAALSRAIKIQMNSFYGVLGTPGCRFFDPRLPTAITRRGHAIIERARRFFEEDEKLRVLYGDTDSLFVEMGEGTDAVARGRAMAATLNERLAHELRESHGVHSRLELRLDVLYERFLLPTMRGSERGSKKRYAGLVRRSDGSDELVVRGLEAVRTDWTPLARRVQRELFLRVFRGEAYVDWLRALRVALFHGELDAELVYEKRLRRAPSEYTAAPPHVRAARELTTEEGEVDEVAYVMTVRGPEPLERRTSALDYHHYLEKQLAPACDVMLTMLGTDLAKIAGTQLSLF